MNATRSGDRIRFYFSFRSPYAWIAAERLEPELGDLGVSVECLPIFPTPELFPNDPVAVPGKIAYMAQDVPRLARRQGLPVRFPAASDTDWALPHAAFLGTAAASQDDGRRLMIALFRKRFAEGLDVGEDEVVADAARAAGLAPEAVLAAGHSAELRAESAEGWRRAVERDQIFGVPSFIFAGRLYWGQDRMDFLRDAVLRKRAAPRD